MISPSKSPSKSTFGDAVDDGGAAAVACVACADGTPDNKSPSKLELVVLVGVYVVLGFVRGVVDGDAGAS